MEEHDYLVCPDGADGRLKRRELLLSMMSKVSSTSITKEGVFWKEMAGVLVSKLYTFRQAVTTISQRYFDGEEVLFPNLVRSLADLIKYTEELVVMFNDEVAGKPEDRMDLEALRPWDAKTVMQQISDLVNMAKADALDAVGEHQAATELIQRSLEI